MEKLRKLVKELKTATETYKAARMDGDAETLKKLEKNVLRLMQSAADATTDPQVARYYRKKAEKFSKASNKERDNIDGPGYRERPGYHPCSTVCVGGHCLIQNRSVGQRSRERTDIGIFGESAKTVVLVEPDEGRR